MVEKLEKVPPYTCDVNIKIDVKFIRIKERVGKMIYRSPDDIDYKIKGFAFLPKKEMGTTSTSLFKEDFIAIDMGNENEDQKLAKLLLNDPKENSEHVMLIDLARNDLGRNGTEVKVEKNREIQFFSHVIHLVSKVTANLKDTSKIFQVVMDTFPAGTLSGAPKHKALTLIEKYEKVNRNFYGGAIGYMDFNGNFNHAIIIRSFFSKNNELSYQAGAGIVIKSKPQDELQEVYNKLGALDYALKNAEDIK